MRIKYKYMNILKPPPLKRTITGSFSTFGEFVYNNRHLIETGYNLYDIYKISIFSDLDNDFETLCFNNRDDIYLKIVKEIYKKKELNMSDFEYTLKTPVTPISKKLYKINE
jgi:hypothetical protein